MSRYIRLAILLFVAVSLIYSCQKQTAQVNLESGMVAYFPLNGNANDSTNNVEKGVIDDAVPTKDRFGIDGKAYFFNGKTSRIAIKNIDLSKKIIDKFGETKWTECQGQLYSKYLQFAKPFDGAISTIQDLQKKGFSINIVSHKTKFPYIGEKINLIDNRLISYSNK